MSRNQFIIELHRMGLTPTGWKTGLCEWWEHYDQRRIPITATAFGSASARIAACLSIRRHLGL